MKLGVLTHISAAHVSKSIRLYRKCVCWYGGRGDSPNKNVHNIQMINLVKLSRKNGYFRLVESCKHKLIKQSMHLVNFGIFMWCIEGHGENRDSWNGT